MDTYFYKQNLYKEVTGEEINNMTNNEIFVKCIAENLTHHNFTYKIGLNKDTQIFYPCSNCKSGGFYFTDTKNINKFLHYGTKLANVKIPNNARCYLEIDKIKCDQFILELIEPLKNHKLTKNHDIFSKTANIDTYIKIVKQNGFMIRHIDKDI
jgi:hypothetical protein